MSRAAVGHHGGRGAIRDGISRRVAAAQPEGEIGACDPDLLAAAAFGAVRGVMVHLMERAGTQGPPTAATTLTAGPSGLLPPP